MKEDILFKYAIIDSEIKTLENQKEELRMQILQDMQKANQDSVVHTAGKFTLSDYKKWTYPEEVKTLEDTYKGAKAKAENDGTATCEITKSLRFTPVKI